MSNILSCVRHDRMFFSRLFIHIKALVRKNYGDDVQAVIATHVDKDHLHSHIIINSYSLSGQKFYANKD